MASAFRLEKIDEKISALVFDLPGEKVNKFSTPVMTEFSDLLERMAEDSSIQCLLLETGKENIFIAGADINEIVEITDEQRGYEVSRQGQIIFERFARLPFPTIAVIHGACMGGGTELALACTYRLGSDHEKTRIALPEVNLGLMPGWGGTQRLPRLIGLQRSLDLILTGKRLDARRAFRSGVIDRIIPKELTRETAVEFARDVIDGKDVLKRSRRRLRGLPAALLERNPLGRRLIFRQARKAVIKKTSGHYPAPLEAIRAVKKGLSKSLDRALDLEAQIFSSLIISPVSKNLIKIFFWSEAVKKQNGTGNPDIVPQPVIKAAALGAGVMGGGIAQLFASKKIPVRVKDLNNDALAKAYQQAARVLRGQVKRRRMTQLEFTHTIERITATTDYSGFDTADIVVEAIVEDMGIKKQVLGELEAFIRPDTIVVTNTSSLPVNEMARDLKNPERFLGMHFFNPVHRMPLVEVIRGEKTSDLAVATTFELAKKLGKTPVVVQDGPGFLVNRLLVPYMVEAIALLEEGVGIRRIDETLERFGMPMGPISLFDEVGIDVAKKVAGILQKSMQDRMAESELLTRLIDSGRLGKKTDIGFYRYKNGKKEYDPGIASFLPDNGKSEAGSDALIQRMIYPMINEASRCLSERIITAPRDVDLAMIFGTGFAPFRGGLLSYADDTGIPAIVDSLSSLSSRFGQRFQPSEILIRMAESDMGFYQYFND